MKKRTKFTLMYASIVALFAILAGRLWYLQVVEAQHYAALADTSKQRVDPIPAPRGIIVDDKGRSLVYNVPSWDVEIVPNGIPAKRAHAIYQALSSILHGSPSPRKIASLVHDARFQPYAGTTIKTDVLTSTAMVVEEMHLQLPGVRAVAVSKRSYSAADPNWSLAHILGYTSGMTPGDYPLYRKLYPKERVQPTDQEGSTGVELAVDPYLHGINGRDIVEVDAGERPIRVLKQWLRCPGIRCISPSIGSCSKRSAGISRPRCRSSTCVRARL